VAYQCVPVELTNVSLRVLTCCTQTFRNQPLRKGPTRSTADNAHVGQLKRGMIVEVQVRSCLAVCGCTSVASSAGLRVSCNGVLSCVAQEQKKDERGVLRMNVSAVDHPKLKGWVRNSDQQGSLFEPVS
jgi:hypothetical protein